MSFIFPVSFCKFFRKISRKGSHLLFDDKWACLFFFNVHIDHVGSHRLVSRFQWSKIFVRTCLIDRLWAINRNLLKYRKSLINVTSISGSVFLRIFINCISCACSCIAWLAFVFLSYWILSLQIVSLMGTELSKLYIHEGGGLHQCCSLQFLMKLDWNTVPSYL